MANIILSINAGSSSLKTTVFKEVQDGEEKQLQRLASAQIVSEAEESGREPPQIPSSPL